MSDVAAIEKICPQCGRTYGAESVFCAADGASLRPIQGNADLVGNVIADRYSPERQLAILLRYSNQAEVSSAAANIAYQNQAADFDLLSPPFTLAFYPCVKGRLRLFKQRDMFKARLLRRAKSQFARFFVKRSRDREEDLLLG